MRWFIQRILTPTFSFFLLLSERFFKNSAFALQLTLQRSQKSQNGTFLTDYIIELCPGRIWCVNVKCKKHTFLFSKFWNNLNITWGNLIEHLVQRRVVYASIRYLRNKIYSIFFSDLFQDFNFKFSFNLQNEEIFFKN